MQPVRTMFNYATYQVRFHNLRLPLDSLIGEEGRGFRYVIDGWNAERILLAAEAIGDGYWFIDRASNYAREREVFGAPIGRNQGVQFPYRPRLCGDGRSRFGPLQSGLAFRRRYVVRGRSEYGKTARLRGKLAGSQYLPRHTRRLRLCR